MFTPETPTAQCPAALHHFYADLEQAKAAAASKSHSGLYYVPMKCRSCSGYRVRRVA